MITRVEPTSGANGFEPNYIPFVEFADADFPWRYSLDPGTGPRTRPWLVLLALLPNEFEFVEPADGPAARIRIKDPRSTLPALMQSWAYAHVHVSQGSARLAIVPSMIANVPEAHSSRLLCPRRLQPNSSYTLVLVPATAAGRIAGLGLSETADPPDQPAWDGSTEADFELPIYFQSRFCTSVVEDFELLARRLAPFKLTAASGAAKPKKANADAPGFYPGYSNPGGTFEIQDALIRADRAVEAFNTDPQALHPPRVDARGDHRGGRATSGGTTRTRRIRSSQCRPMAGDSAISRWSPPRKPGPVDSSTASTWI